MGGAATGIQVAGIAGATFIRVVDVPGLAEMFQSVYRTAKSDPDIVGAWSSVLSDKIQNWYLFRFNFQ